jgi:hypothetical protein
MMTFRLMKNNIDRLVEDLNIGMESIKVISNNLQNLDYVLNKVIYLKSYALN